MAISAKTLLTSKFLDEFLGFRPPLEASKTSRYASLSIGKLQTDGGLVIFTKSKSDIFKSSRDVPKVHAISPSTRSRLLMEGFLVMDCFGSIPSNSFRSPSKKLMFLREDEMEAFKGIQQSLLHVDGRIDELFAKLMDLDADNLMIMDEVLKHREQIKKLRREVGGLHTRNWFK